jgi:MOSC domain-containing protein YiiM
MSRVEHIHIAHEAAKPMLPLREAEIIAGQGISGDRYALKLGYYSHDPKPGRHLTLIEAEVLEDISQQLGGSFSAPDSRRNLTTRGVRLNPLIGKRLRIGAVLLEVIRLCDPCAYLQELVGQPVLKPLVDRGGIRCDVITGGIIRVGDTISVVE